MLLLTREIGALPELERPLRHKSSGAVVSCRRGNGGRGAGELARCLATIILSPDGERKRRVHAKIASALHLKSHVSTYVPLTTHNVSFPVLSCPLLSRVSTYKALPVKGFPVTR